MLPWKNIDLRQFNDFYGLMIKILEQLEKRKTNLHLSGNYGTTYNKNKFYLPGENLTINEQLVPFRGRVGFKQYLPGKPDKYGKIK